MTQLVLTRLLAFTLLLYTKRKT